MKEEDQLRDKFGTETGFRVPDGYFDYIFNEIESRLPEHPGLKTPMPISRWQRLKPYVYLAAMFAGIWCTMKMVSMMSESGQEEVSLSNPPQMIAKAMDTPEVVAQVCSSPSVMVVENFEETLTEEAVPGSEDEIVAEDNAASDNYYDETNFVDVSDVDLDQLQAALAAEDSAEEDYYYYI